LKYLIEFIKIKDVSKSHIFKQLKCSKEETKVLQYICKEYVSSTQEIPVINILKNNFSSKDYIYLTKLSIIKKLLDLGWITQVSFEDIKSHEVTTIELLNSSFMPSVSMLKLLEKGSLEVSLPKIKPYTDHLEYLQDQFDVINLLQKISTSRHNYKESSINITRINNRINLLSKRIQKRLKITTKPIVIEEFFTKNSLSDNEKNIFLALLKEEYSGGEGDLRDMNTLIELISFDEYEKIKNRSLLEDGAKLISENIIDYEEILNMFGGISRAFYIKDELLQEIIHPKKKEKVIKLKLDALIKEQDLFEYIEPNSSLDDVVLNPKTRDRLNSLIKQVDKRVTKKLKKWGIKKSKRGIDAKIIFYGTAGTGKTMTAISLAKTLDRAILSFDCSKIFSMYIGESEKNVRKIFDDFKELSKKAKTSPILLLDEADQFLSKRSKGDMSSADKMHNQMQNIFLEQIEKFEGILIATTNLLDNIDKAFSRRFNYKIEFKKPSLKQRVRLWRLLLPQNADFESDFEIEKLSNYELTGGQISLVVKNTAYKVAVREESIFSMRDFIEEINSELDSNFNDNKSMGFKI